MNKKTLQFLKALDKATSHDQHGHERALYLLLEMYADSLPSVEDGHWFHKAFRTLSVTGTPQLDRVIWNLIHASTTIWEVLPQFSTRATLPGERNVDAANIPAQAEASHAN